MNKNLNTLVSYLYLITCLLLHRKFVIDPCRSYFVIIITLSPFFIAFRKKNAPLKDLYLPSKFAQ